MSPSFSRVMPRPMRDPRMSRWVSAAPFGNVPVGEGVLRLLPVGGEIEDVPLRALIAPEGGVPGIPPGGQQIGGRGLLPRGQEGGVGGDAPVLGQLQLVQHPGQQGPLLPASGAAVQQFGLVHSPASSRAARFL